ncbi:uncharacterized protein LOC122266082 isoform X2 [Penaeus japonicus]|uniref:uncharacterized protein LOC122258115 isoform X2 n=1 Tax=Penaeus japonicus TaxID=27405 RepID=UPI001C70D410|nr:uncharacterized protein LOC122258115 isoform X2 [Penaeus japonicus]XP_042891619.1 uncharacterized protein LOC122266082 isoform X2 [Penaeus japonicus]
MAPEWMSPLLISVLRLIFIATLSIVNWVALWRLSCSSRRDGRKAERLLITSIIVVSLVYLTAVWAPFTLSALKHDLSDLQGGGRAAGSFQPLRHDAVRSVQSRSVDSSESGSSDEFTVEYVDLTNGEVYASRAEALSRASRATTGLKALTAEEHNPPREIPVDPSSAKPSASFTAFPMTTSSLAPVAWSSDEQDLITSSCAYSLAFTAVARLAILRRPLLHPRGSWGVGAGAGVLVGVPAAVTVLVRTLGGTTPHFAPHQPEVTAAGYFLYSIICDAHITQAYVISLFLEWAALFTLLLVILALVVSVATRSSKVIMREEEEDLHEEEEGLGSVESWARDAVLTVGALWAWPLKPTLVLVLYCVYGPHWTNVVCWLAHVVVAIPTVFIPLAVFLSPQSHTLKAASLPTAEDLKVRKEKESQVNKVVQEKETVSEESAEGKEAASEVRGDEFPRDAVAEEEKDQPDSQDTRKAGESPRDNLKFYLGTDILKYGIRSSQKHDDRKMILTNEWGLPSISEV